jgi:Zn-dependent protease
MANIFGGIGQWLVTLVYSLPGILIGLVMHEFAHAAMAHKLGDPTPKMMGRLTLNPIAHIDPIGLLMLFVARFGWAKPVMTNPAKYKIKRYGFALVGVAGPLTNFLLATVFIFSYLGLAYNVVLNDSHFLMQILLNAAWINLALGIFNLMPIPPLDGYNIIKDLFLVKFIRSQALWNFERYGQLLLIAFVIGSSYLGLNFIGSAVLFLLKQAEQLYRLLFL